MSVLSDLLERGDVYFSIFGDDRFAALSAFSGILELPASLDRKILAAALEERERLTSTAMGCGIAIPHPRRRMPDSPDDALLAIGYLDTPLDWDAPDGMPVATLFLPLAADPETHLHVLAEIAGLASRAEFRELLKSWPGRKELLDYLRKPVATI